MWIAAHSFTWYPTLIEIEDSTKKLLIKNGRQTAKFSEAKNQLDRWHSWFDNPTNVHQFIELYGIPSSRRSHTNWKLYMILVYGRRSEFNNHPEISKLRSTALGLDLEESGRPKTSGRSTPFRAFSFGELTKETESTSTERSGEKSESTSVFISYRHKDKRWLERLQVHLKPVTQQANIRVWDDTLIEPSMKWLNEIKRELASARAAGLLVSADFLASEFITKIELPALLAAAESAGTIILPVIVSPCRFQQTPSLSQFQGVNLPKHPLNAMSKTDQEEVFVRVAESVEKALKS
jgi:hypothetical protein